MRAGVYNSGGIDWVHRNSRFQMLLELGMEGIKERAQKRLRSLDETRAEDVKRKPFYQAVIIVCDGLMNYAERWAEKLDDLALLEKPSFGRWRPSAEECRVCLLRHSTRRSSPSGSLR